MQPKKDHFDLPIFCEKLYFGVLMRNFFLLLEICERNLLSEENRRDNNVTSNDRELILKFRLVEDVRKICGYERGRYFSIRRFA